MKLHADAPSALNTITGYGPGFVEINKIRCTTPLIITPDPPLRDWNVAGFDELSASSFEALLELKPELVILGTGRRQRFPHPKLLQPLTRERIGVEVMDTAAACRTYNILMAEGRRVAAALLIDP